LSVGLYVRETDPFSCAIMTEEFVRNKPLTPDERKLRDMKRRVDAEIAIREHEEAQKAFRDNRERLRAARLARDAAEKKQS
jgi:F0F1-type ATP synthase epsilon subunit